MIEETGIVVLRDGLFAEIETERRTSCGSCSAQSGCGVSLLDRFLGRRVTRLSAINRIDAQPGQRVVVGVPEGSVLSASVAAYLIPILALLGGSMLGQELARRLDWAGADLISLLGALVGLTMGLFWLARFSRARRGDDRYQAVILRIEPPSTAQLVPLFPQTLAERSRPSGH